MPISYVTNCKPSNKKWHYKGANDWYSWLVTKKTLCSKRLRIQLPSEYIEKII